MTGMRLQDKKNEIQKQLCETRASFEPSRNLSSDLPATLEATTRSKSAKGRGATSSVAIPDVKGFEADLARLRLDLASTQTARASLQARVDELSRDLTEAQSKAKSDSKRLQELAREKVMAERKLKDWRDEERGKKTLVDNIQDELVSLSLQFNMAEQRAEKLKAENDQLVERWMRHKGEEAERMNEASKWT
ncbi:autophagy protein 16, interacts with Atg12p-Atg5p [Elasticomyces elasticus]|nr:autophagy protein 16, interacts with Atg12p-Atg5p [Elasticomyces elasticus]